MLAQHEQLRAESDQQRDRLLGLLHPGMSDGCDLRALRDPHPPDTFTVATGHAHIVNQFIDEHRASRNIFFGVAARLPGPKSTTCARLHALFVDIDFGKTPEAEARKKLAAFPHPPNAVIASGGGLHGYWFLTAPIDLATDALRAKQVLQTLAGVVGGDRSAAEPARILRMPGTFNYKYDPPRLVTIERLTDQRYDLADILAVLPAMPDAPAPRGAVQHSMSPEARVQIARRYLARQEPAIQGAHGDDRTFQVCASVVVGHDLTEDAAFAAMAEWNARCSPPWSEHELRLKIRNARQYATGRRGELLQGRVVGVQWANEITPQVAEWLWSDRLSMGELALMAGREGCGKSTLAYTLIADITRGRLPGKYYGIPRPAIVAATEDSWEHTIVSRLIAPTRIVRRWAAST